MRRLLLILCSLAALWSCNSQRALLPNVSGKAGEVIVVMDKTNWEGDLGTTVRELLGSDCPYLAQREPLYNLVNVAPNAFAEILQVHRNILLFNIDDQVKTEGLISRSDVWAQPQCVLQINAHDGAQANALVTENSQRILSTIEQAERDRIIAASKLYEEHSLAPVVTNMVGGSPHFPSGYKLKKATDGFIWIADEKQYTNQGIFIYKYPVEPTDENFSVESIIANRNRILQANVPGMFDNTYVTTSTYITPTVEYIRFRGRQFAQTRGFWEVYGDFMGGPFVSHAFYSQDGREMIVLDAWVYAPKYDKRHYLRQVEAIIYSYEWANHKQDEEN